MKGYGRYRRSLSKGLNRASWSGLLWLAATTTTNTIIAAQSAAPPAPKPTAAQGAPEAFDVVSIKAADPSSHRWKMDFTRDGFEAENVTLRTIIQEAYATYDENRLTGGPAWLRTERFVVQAKVDPAQAGAWSTLSRDRRRTVLQKLLADRFQLIVSHTSQEMPVYAMVMAKSGLKLRLTDTAKAAIDGSDPAMALFTRSRPGVVQGENFSMHDVARFLSDVAGRIVVDETGLSGRYDIALQWKTEEMQAKAPAPENDPSATAGNAGESSLFSAVQDQMGLKLNPSESALDVLVVDSATKPPEN